MRISQLVAGMAVILGAASANAEVIGIYAGAGVGQVELSEEVDGLEFDANDTLFTVFGGYQFNDYFAVELGYIDGGTADDSVAGVDVEVSTEAVQASILGSVPIGSKFSIYGRAGIISWKSETFASSRFGTFEAEGEGEDFAWGIGGAFKPIAPLMLRVEYGGAEIEATDMRIITVSAAYVF